MKPFPIGLQSSRAFSLKPSLCSVLLPPVVSSIDFPLPSPTAAPIAPCFPPPLSHSSSLCISLGLCPSFFLYPCNPSPMYQGRGSVSAPYRDANLNLFFCCVWAPDISDRSLWKPSLVCHVIYRAVGIFFFVISDLIWTYWKHSLDISVSTGLFEMIVAVLTTCHTKYTWDKSICIFFI